ncbi:glycosyltransferase [Arthrobacter sp. NPDC056727]|uniref:glycosyltransferase n=1 Tax=Arthrobacter sp. NPDC056727 TaxID=3345927 RepID=UPI0036710A73
MRSEPKVLQFNDCAFVARNMVRAAARAGIEWAYLPPEQVRPMTAAPANPLLARARFIPFVARRALRLSAADVVHVHYGTSVRLIRERGMPRRPYVLTLHGSDIRRQWKDRQFHDEIQRAIDGAEHVFYANTDNEQDARAARSDAEFLPSLVDVAALPSWAPVGPPTVLFISRWDDDKGVNRQLKLVEELCRATKGKADVVGLDWGPGAAEAERLGVRMLEKLPREQYYERLSRAWVGVGQASNYFSTSEFEALCIGLPVAAVGTRLPRPDDGTVPPVMEGSVSETVEQIVAALDDPHAVSARLGGRAWAVPRYDAAPYVPKLDTLYKRISGR